MTLCFPLQTFCSSRNNPALKRSRPIYSFKVRMGKSNASSESSSWIQKGSAHSASGHKERNVTGLGNAVSSHGCPIKSLSPSGPAGYLKAHVEANGGSYKHALRSSLWPVVEWDLTAYISFLFLEAGTSSIFVLFSLCTAWAVPQLSPL